MPEPLSGTPISVHPTVAEPPRDGRPPLQAPPSGEFASETFRRIARSWQERQQWLSQLPPTPPTTPPRTLYKATIVPPPKRKAR